MATPVTQSQAVPARIESGRILDVDTATYTVSVTTEFTKKPFTGVKFATPYQHYANGEGVYFMPEIGALCWICIPSDHNRPFVIAFGPASADGDMRAKKKDLNPGDIYLGTRDENFLILRRGGIVQIGGGPLSQRIFMPVNNTISDFCENYGLHTLGGDLEWTVQRTEKTTDGKRPATLKISAREFTDDPKPVAQLEIGSHDDNDKHILSLKIKASGADSADTVISLFMTKEGKIEWNVKKDVTWTVEGNYNVAAKQKISLSADDNIELTSKKKVTVKGTQGVDIDGGGSTVNIKGAPLVKMDSLVQAGGSQPVAMAAPLITWLSTHLHNVTAVGSPTSPPLVPPPGTISSQSCFAK